MKYIRAIIYLYVIEVTLLLSMGIASIIVLHSVKVVQNIFVLSSMMRASLFFSFVAIPIESIIFYRVTQKNTIKWSMLSKSDAVIFRLLYLSAVIFLVLWFLHIDIWGNVAKNILGYVKGSDEYLLWGRPGNCIILSASFGTCMIHATLKKLL